MRIGQVFRYAQSRDPSPPEIDGISNFFHETFSPGHRIVALERGINPISPVKAQDGTRRPAILIRSSPHKIGSETTPWQDYFDPDNGHIRYYGDSKVGKPVSAENVPGNRLLLEEFRLHQASEEDLRRRATPLLFFLSVPHAGRVKGYVEFQGFGIIERGELVAQWDPRARASFSNYRFDFVVMSLASENEEFDWRWIDVRRDRTKTLDECHELAPEAWRVWAKEGSSVVERARRRVSQLRTIKETDQRAAPKSKEEKVLREIQEFYSSGKHRFEALAEIVAERVLQSSGAQYKRGWITPPASDGGADFIGRLDVGTGFLKAKLVVLGQAKCEKTERATGGTHIARTAARLRRGWIGVYVTTSYFSRRVQQEVIEDEYPLVLIHGRQLTEVVLQMMFELGMPDVFPLLQKIDREYPQRIQSRRPSEILLD